jgi:hypothetical protein
MFSIKEGVPVSLIDYSCFETAEWDPHSDAVSLICRLGIRVSGVGHRLVPCLLFGGVRKVTKEGDVSDYVISYTPSLLYAPTAYRPILGDKFKRVSHDDMYTTPYGWFLRKGAEESFPSTVVTNLTYYVTLTVYSSTLKRWLRGQGRMIWEKEFFTGMVSDSAVYAGISATFSVDGDEFTVGDVGGKHPVFPYGKSVPLDQFFTGMADDSVADLTRPIGTLWSSLDGAGYVPWWLGTYCMSALGLIPLPTVGVAPGYTRSVISTPDVGDGK